MFTSLNPPSTTLATHTKILKKKTAFIKSTHFVTVIILTSTHVPITRQSTNTPLSPLLFIFPTVIKQQKISTKQQKNQLTERKGEKKKGKRKKKTKELGIWHCLLLLQHLIPWEPSFFIWAFSQPTLSSIPSSGSVSILLHLIVRFKNSNNFDMVMVSVLILFGFLLGVVAVVAAEALGLLWILKRLRSKVIDKDQAKISSKTQLGGSAAPPQIDPHHSLKKEVTLFVLPQKYLSIYLFFFSLFPFFWLGKPLLLCRIQ